MQYGYFDDKNKEYVITRPDTPKPWSNYLGNTEYGAIITNNAGGYSFYKSGGMGRFIRMRFNSVPLDQPGRYLYFHDTDSKDFWSASWQPVGKPLEDYRSTCRHGLGYTIIESEYAGIRSEVTYYVPLNQAYEVWKVKVANTGMGRRRFRVFSYLEYAANWNAIDDLLNLQYVQYTSTMKVVGGIIGHGTNVNIPEMPDNFGEKDQERHSFQAAVGLEMIGYDTDRESFLGPYRTYANPVVVEKGEPGNTLGYGDNPCGSLCGALELPAGASETFLFIVGVGKAEEAGLQAVEHYRDIHKADEELEALQRYWAGRLKGFESTTLDPALNSTINTWGIYNALITFAWSRAASFIYTGIDRDGLGYRDSVQDLLGVAHAIPEEVKARLELLISGQESTGGARPVILPVAHRPGQEPPTAEEDYRSDDCLWLFNAVPAYVKETGDFGFFRKAIPYSDKGEATVFAHLRRAIAFNLERSGRHGFPCGLKADWNDCLQFGPAGESVFVALQLRLALREYAEIAGLLNEKAEKAWAQKRLVELDENIQRYAWDGEWFLRGYRADGLKFGSKDSAEGQIFMNPQAWAILSGAATEAQAALAMENVYRRLFTDFGIKVCDPPYTNSDHNIVRAQLMNPGLKENGGIFMHTQGWGVMAEAMLGHGNRAYEYLLAYLPAARNQEAEVREIEPYVLCQSTHAPPSPKFGASRIPWLSGSATWTYYAITQYVLGVRPEYHGLTISPCVPSHWSRFSIRRRFRGKTLNIQVLNKKGVEKGVVRITIDGNTIDGNFVPLESMKDESKVVVEMG